MNRIAALVISTILLTQIASYSFAEITPQVEWEEPLQGDPDWKVTGRNSTSNNSNESVWGESFETPDSNTGGTYSEIVWEAYNLANDTTYNVSYDLWKYDNSTSGLTLTYTAANMTIFNSSSTFANYVYNQNNSTASGYWTTSYTTAGCYHVLINIRNATTGALFSSYGFDWDVDMYCGDETVDINHSGYVWETPNQVEIWDSGTDVHVQFTSGNLEVGESYQLIWNLSSTSWNHGSHGSGNVNWNATSNSSVENSTISGLPDGIYYFFATLVKDGSVHVATDNTMIQMGNNTSTGGNNTGGNNTGGNNTGGNNTGGNNTGGNNTGGNNTGGNTDTNNTGGNNTGGMGTNPGNPIMPSNCTRIDWNLTTNVTIDDCINGTSAFWFEFNNTGGIVWIDPEVAIGYDYEVFSSHLITDVTIPHGYGDNVFDLFLKDANGLWYDSGYDIFAGQTYTFTSPVSVMSIRGIEATSMLSPTDPSAFVSGLSFDTNGSVVMTMTPVVGNYTCGDDKELTDLSAWFHGQSANPIYQLGDAVDVFYYVNCTVFDEDYELRVSLNGNNIHSSWVWTASTLNELFTEDLAQSTNLSVGTHCLNATLLYQGGGGLWIVDNACFEVIDNTGGNNTGGNNTGGNNTGWNDCGNATTGWNLTDMMSWTNDYIYEEGENVYFNWYVNCTIINETYYLNATVYNEDDGVVHGDYTYEWMATSITWSESEHEPLPVGDYCMNSTLSSNGLFIVDHVCFSVYPPMPVVYGWAEYD